uniref:Integrase zinc-binding domain-containing protein n=1 Tax=Biomphalaria glabrata TaxID=6526 RepID=A0A2C9LWG4_BIOGL
MNVGKKQAVSKNQNFDRPTSPTQRYSNREQYNLNKAPGNNKPDNKPRYRSHSQDSRPQYMPNRSSYNRSYYNEHSTMTVIAKSNGLKFYPGFVGDKKVEVLRDTGSTSTLVHERFVHANRFTGNHVQATAFNGTVSRLPEAIIYVTTPFFSGQTKALVTPNLPNKPYFQDGLLVKNAMHKDNTVQQIIVPQKYRKEILATGHNIPHASHMGVIKTKARILKEFYWPSIIKDVKKYVKSCHICQVKGPKNNKSQAPIQDMELTDKPFQKVSVDLIGPMPVASARNHRYVLTLIDTCTRWTEAVPLVNIT